ncbi:MAG: Gfo/Idh/MocA family oxidoreductase [Chloroherpetonaceae bacterium]|nr:Gfo/Idh/MocA family oxidoreductase [Chthonomonadaceae bacterium]MDW8206893.1 Gfo/Idh/MocA family oxidoreductase [Chloroherpetonaceae bacterium]
MRVIQAGVGGFGSSWVYALRDCGYTHVALIDTDPEALCRAGEAVGVPPERRFTRVEDALERVDADCFMDVTPPHLHALTTLAALRAGLHVLVEKPMAVSMTEAQEMVRVARERKRVLMVTQQFRYYDQPRTVRRLIAEGHIGDVDHVVTEFQIQGLLFGWRQRMRHPFLMDMAIHHFDLMRYLLHAEARRVMARTWNPTVSNTQGDMNAFVWFEFDGGVRVNYTGGFASPGCDTGWNGRWVITGTRGTIIWNPRDDWGPIRLFRQNADLSRYTEQTFFTPLPEVWGEPIPAASIGPQGHHHNLHQWRVCMESGREPETSGRDNLHTLAMVFATMEAADSRREIAIAHDIEP